MRHRIPIACLVALSVLLLAADRPPWRARRRPGLRPNHIASARVLPSDWPSEPSTPRNVDTARFATAIRELCGGGTSDRAQRLAEAITSSAREFEVDPFLLGALVYREGRCRADAENGERGSGLGLTLIHREMYVENLRAGVLRFRVREGDRWRDRERRVDRFPFAGPRLTQTEPNVYFAAALLAAWRDQHETVDHEFTQEPHRHFVSHFVWGDRVRSDSEEEQILTDRRRLLEYYGARASEPTLSWRGLTLGCPLDGCPRVITSWLGSDRDGGDRSHRGVDVDSLPGEPVRAIADGLVVFAGVDLPGGQNHRQLAQPADYESIARDALGAGGRYVCVRHTEGVRSCAMHLEEVHVRYGMRVRRGDRIGTVGRSGMSRSAAHLHLEMYAPNLEDPSAILRGLLLGRRDADPFAQR